jgi:gallate decarboxylase subunit D
MRIEVKLLASLRFRAGDADDGLCRLDVPAGSTAGDVLANLAISDDPPVIILVNGTQQQPGAELHDGDALVVFPPIAGGSMAVKGVPSSVFCASSQSGGCRLEAQLRLIGEDVLVSVWGGTGPHIGAVAVAAPWLGGRERSEKGATLSMYTFPGHRDDVVADLFARSISGALQRTTVVTAGIHMDRITPEGIDHIMLAVQDMCGCLITEVRAHLSADQD